MSRLKRDMYRRKLAAYLAEANDEDFCQLVWAVDALQSGRPREAARYLRYPQSAIAKLGGPMHVPKWSMETLVNELLARPKLPDRDGVRRVVNCQTFDAIITPFNILRDLENVEDGISLENKSVLHEMSRLGHRQFEWQRGVENFVHLYRSIYLFGGPLCSAYFADNYGLSPADFVLAGFVAYSVSGSDSAFHDKLEVAEVGLTAATFKAALKLVAMDHAQARREARRLRAGNDHIAYKASVLRRHPCIVFGSGRIRAPLRQLLLARATSGLYYDVVGAGGNVPREIGQRFESYCLELLKPAWPQIAVSPSFKYRAGPNVVDAPDILISAGESIRLVVECKAKRMPFAARFGEDLLRDPDASRGFDELAKGIFQIWRFNAHVRRGLIPERLHADVLGVVITLDHWLTMARHRYSELMARAGALASEHGELIQPEDRRPVAFCPIEDLEQVLRSATFESFCAAVSEAADNENAGWHFAHLHDRFSSNKSDVREYPFAGQISSLLPWWDMIGD